MLQGATSSAVAGMICGVFCYVVAYTALEHTLTVRRLLTDKCIRRTAKIGYGTRIGISIVFPIGFYLDLMVGIVVVPVSHAILAMTGNDILNSNESGGDFLTSFLMTLVQGACLNVVLLAYMIVVYAIVRSVMGKSESDKAGAQRR